MARPYPRVHPPRGQGAHPLGDRHVLDGRADDHLREPLPRKDGSVPVARGGTRYSRSTRGSSTSSPSDVTRRKTAEISLRESEEKLRALYDGIPHHLVVVDKDARIVSVNRPSPGVREEGIVGRSLLRFHGAGIPRHGEGGAPDGAPGGTCELRGGRPRGERRAGVVRELHGRAIRGSTRSRTAGENITRAPARRGAAPESEARFHAAVEASMDAFLTPRLHRDDSEEIADFRVITG